jgi:hypothetical protein
MSALVKISDYPINQNFLLDRKWKETDYYELCCKSELWGCAFLVVLDKRITSISNEAIIYLLERLIIESEGWDEKIQSEIDENFREYIFAGGYLSDPAGWTISNDEFWNNYEEITNGISATEDFQITKNGNLTKNDPLIKRNEILSVVCFGSKWNNRQYFVESYNTWSLFTWATSA